MTKIIAFFTFSIAFISLNVLAKVPLAPEHIQQRDSSFSQCSSLSQERISNWGFFGDVLYWHALETVDWSYVLELKGKEERAHFHTISFDWDPGFRVGFDYHMKHDQWDAKVYYTCFQAQTSDHAQAPADGWIVSAFLGNKVADAGSYQTAKMHWKLLFNMFDGEVGRSFYPSKRVELHPFLGIKGGMIHQKIHTHWENPDFLDLKILLLSNENLKNNFWGIGPKTGVNGKWILGNIRRYSFSLLGDFAAAYLFGQWKIKDKFRDNFQTDVSVKVGNRKFGAFMLQGFMGLGLDYMFVKTPDRISMKLGYEIQDWLNQFQVLDDLSGAQNADVILQGATFRLQLDF